MITKEGHIEAIKQFRYYTFGEITQAKHLIIALHGYGQLAEYFMRKFQQLQQDYFIVCPEGMHRFYLKGANGRVGASWMTKEDRLNDIADNNIWLTKLLQTYTESHPFETLTILGFSQGGATAARWHNYLSTNYKLNLFSNASLILWGAVFPPDLEITSDYKSKSRHYFVLGETDEYFQGKDKSNTLATYESMCYTIKTYNGGHNIDSDLLKTLLKNLHINNQF